MPLAENFADTDQDDMSLAKLETLKLCQSGSPPGNKIVKVGGVRYKIICDDVIEGDQTGRQLTTTKLEEALIMCSTIPTCEAVTMKEPGETYAYWNADRNVGTVPQRPGVTAVAIESRSAGASKANTTPDHGQCPGIGNLTQWVGGVQYKIACTKFMDGVKNPYRTTAALKNIFECLALCAYDPTCAVIAPGRPSEQCGMGEQGSSLAQGKKGYTPDYWVASRVGKEA
ncbi:hypothetical protein BJY04DRAFT_222805 [Aspergillus karnatakaensis]|uniref:uncharacterized protein n=1 Tax=Aspergillus karnatakaensis TaxID=1810916 RepID=UPI003CCCCDED